ncbi:MAG: hypothetical protein ACON31_05755 [Candidatus Puniceispirillaceae bacterium]
MTARLRADIRKLVAAAAPKTLTLFDDNQPVRGPALEKGYLRLSIALEDGETGLGAHLPRLGRLGIIIAVPAGTGSGAGDSVIEALNSGLSFGGSRTVRFGGLAVTPGRQVGQLWVIDTEIGFTDWGAGVEADG